MKKSFLIDTLAVMTLAAVLAALCGVPVLITVPGYASSTGGFTAFALLTAFWGTFLSIGICMSVLLLFKHHWNVTERIRVALAKNVRCLPHSGAGYILASVTLYSGRRPRSRRAAAAPSVCARRLDRDCILFSDQQLHRTQDSVC